MKKLSEIIEGMFHPEGPGPENKHKSAHQGLFSRFGGYKPFNVDKEEGLEDEDIDNGDAAIDAIEELFKFTKSATDNTSFARPSTQGAGPPSAYGKDMDSFGNFDPTLEDEKTNKKRKKSFAGRKRVSVTALSGKDNDASVEPTLEAGSARSKIPRDGEDYTTKNGYSNGLATDDQLEIDEFDELLKKVQEYATDDFSRGSQGNIARPHDDLNFLDILKRRNNYLISDVEVEDETKEEEEYPDSFDDDPSDS